MSWHTPGEVHAYSFTGTTLQLQCPRARVAISILNASSIRVQLAPDREGRAVRPWQVGCTQERELATVGCLTEGDDRLILDNGAFQVVVERHPCRISFQTAQGRLFCADGDGLQWSDEGVACSKRITPHERFYGFGERTGPLEKRGHRLTNWNVDAAPTVQDSHDLNVDPLYIAVPLYLSLQPGLAYSLLFNNTWKSQFDVGRHRPDELRFQAAGGALDYTVSYGLDPAAVSKAIANLLGTMPLPPLWALGYHQSRWSYASEAEIRQVAAGFRGREIPCDAIYFDIDYMDGYRVFTWHPARFPDPERLLADLQRDGFRAVLIVDPGVKVDPRYTVYEQGRARSGFVRHADGSAVTGYVWPDLAVWPDFFRDDVRAWWGDLIGGLVRQGVQGIWNDMNEPTLFEKPFSEGGGRVGTIDDNALHGSTGAQATHAELHNLYGQQMARAAYEGLRRHLPDRRPFVLTRAGFAGIQCWSACWTGDNKSRWDHLQLALPQLLNLGISGIPFVGVDIGGFGENATPELFARWMQFGALMPFCRGHTETGSRPHEPWSFGPEIESICRDYLQLRYRLLPYLYSLFWEASRTGMPILRPLFYEFPHDERCFTLQDQVMLGPFLMAAPVTTSGAQARDVHFPAGRWYDWWTDQIVDGPVQISVHAPLTQMPLFVRAGAILPTAPDGLQHTAAYRLSPLTLQLYPGDGEFTLYEDDGQTHAHERGVFCTTRYRLDRQGDSLRLTIEERQGSYRPPERDLLLKCRHAQVMVSDSNEESHQARWPVTLVDKGREQTLTLPLK